MNPIINSSAKWGTYIVLEPWFHSLVRELTNSQVHAAVVRNRFNMHCLLEVGSFKIPQKLRMYITRLGRRCE